MNYVALKSFSRIVVPLVAFLMTFFAWVISIFLVTALAVLLWTHVPPLLVHAYSLLGFDAKLATYFGFGTVASGLALAAVVYGGTMRAHDGQFNLYWTEDRGGKL